MNLFKKLAVRLMLVSMLALFAGAVSAQKESPAEPATEADSSMLTLPTLLDGEAAELTLEDSDGALLVAFNASEGDEVTISMNSDDLDPYLVLFGSAAQLLASDDDSGEESFAALIEDFEIPEDGTYFILATTFFSRNTELIGEDDPTFTLLVEGNTQPEGVAEDSFSYFSVSATIGETVELPIDETQPSYFVTFEGAEGDEIVINAPSPELDTLAMLFDAQGQRIAVDDDGGEEPLAAMIEAELPTDGLYFLLVTTYNFAQVADGTIDVIEGTIDLSIE